MFMIVILVVACGFVVQDAPLPEELLAAQRFREDLFLTAHIRWVRETPQGRRYYSSTYAPGDFLLKDHGDETGLVDPQMVRPNMAHAYSERRLLMTEGRDQWDYRDQGLLGLYFEPGCPVIQEQPDLRTLGWIPSPMLYDRPDFLQSDTFLQSALAGTAWEFQVDYPAEGLCEVRAKSSSQIYLWKLDATQGYAPISVQTTATFPDGSTRTYESRFQYAEYDGRRFPSQIEMIDGPRGVCEVVKILHAEFDKPWHALDLIPGEALEMPARVNIGYQYAGGTPADAKLGPHLFDGHSRPLNDAELKELADKGQYPPDAVKPLIALHKKRPLPGSTPVDAVAFLDAPGEPVRRALGRWEEYVRRYIIIHKMNDAQARAAWKKLSECQEQARAHLEDHKAEIAENDRMIDAAKKDAAAKSSSPAESKPQESTLSEDVGLAELQARRAKLVDEPLDKIFDKCLRASLWELLTSAQQRSWNDTLKSKKVDRPQTPVNTP